MKITKTQLKRIIKEELTEVGQWGLGVSGASTRSVADPHTAAIEALAGYIRNRYREDQKLLDLLQAAEEAVTDFENTMTEGFGLVGALSAVKDAENQGMADAQDDFMRSQRGEEVSPDLPSFGSAEEEDAYGMAWGKEWHRLMDNAVKNRVDMERELDRPPEPETDADREAADAELDFESTYSEGTNKIKKGNKMKLTKTKLRQIIREEMASHTRAQLQREFEYLVKSIIKEYSGDELPAPIERLKEIVGASDWETLRKETIKLWEELNHWHQKRRTRVAQSVTKNFNAINTLLRKF